MQNSGVLGMWQKLRKLVTCAWTCGVVCGKEGSPGASYRQLLCPKHGSRLSKESEEPTIPMIPYLDTVGVVRVRCHRFVRK